MFADPLARTLAAFVERVGVPIRLETMTVPGFLPGLDIRDGAVIADPDQLAHPGDLLHEAGHLAVTDPNERNRPALTPDGGDELAAIAWSWAALTALDCDPAVVFHPGGYKGNSAAIIANFSTGRYFGVPLLHCYGMTIDPTLARAGAQAFPHMLRWLR